MNRYVGGKNGAGVYQTIINRVPVHDLYVEAFAGSAAIYRKKAPAASSILVERDPGQVSRLAVLASASTTVVCADAVLHLEALVPAAMPARVFVYLDPPYVHAARRDLSLYRYEMTDEQHRHLVGSVLPALSDRGVRWMLSGYRNAIYAEASSSHGWHEHDFQAMTRRGPATETLWMNYDPARVAIAEPTFAGDNFRERERIKRKAARWAAKFHAMPPAEQAAVMAMLQPRHARRCGPESAPDGFPASTGVKNEEFASCESQQ